MLAAGNTAGGAIAECPFCLARRHPWPQIGTSITLLSGYDVGQSGVVVEDQWGTCPPDRFLVKMAYDESGALRMVMPSHELFLDVKQLVVPAWMPSLSIEDNGFLHESLMRSLEDLKAARGRENVGKLILALIATCWGRRLPLRGTEVWLLLNAHGVGSQLKSDVIEYFDFGMKLLTETQGRPAVKRRRMPAMSRGRYLTKARRTLRAEIFGHD
jgi:hypothetical protein